MANDVLGVEVIALEEIGRGQVELAGGKGAQLGELMRIEGISVPAGFVVTTAAFRRMVGGTPVIADLLDRLSSATADDARTISAAIRAAVERVAMPDDLLDAIAVRLDRLGGPGGCAVRSSATAEDLPAASFAGQHDTFLDVVGPAAVVRDIRRCWASLFTERAVDYRVHHGIDHRTVEMAVVVQQMVAAQASGVLFTADPVSGNRTMATVEAVVGLGEAFVSGLVNADVATVGDGGVVTMSIAAERAAVGAAPLLTDAQVVRLVSLGRLIEARAGCPQDVEWCLVGDAFRIVQSRPITTLFPIPEVDDRDHHVYVSVGHQQMMTDAMKPLGFSMWQLKALPRMHEAGGRLFVEVTDRLAAPASRAGLLDMIGRGDPLIRDALQTIVDRDAFLPSMPDALPVAPPAAAVPSTPIETDPAIVDELIAQNRASVAALEHDIRGRSGPALFDFILADIQELKRILFDPRSFQAIMAGMDASWWLNEHLEAWLGEKNLADALTQSAPHNVTAEMGLALLDVADVVRPHPEVVAFLTHVEHDGFLDDLAQLPGGREARDAIQAYLDRYGMRCVGEIDITRPRWRERPATLLPALLGNVSHFEAGEAGRRFRRGQEEAARTARDVLARLRALPDGEHKAEETARTIERVRTFMGYREYPKYGIVCRSAVYKRALMDEAARLVRAGVIGDGEDIFFLTFQELHGVVRTGTADHDLIRRRRDEFRVNAALTPPRVLTSDGEILNGAYHRDDVAPGALVGLAVSAGTVEGRARVVLDMATADLEPGDILVTPYTDPSWTPLFVTVAGLVTEVGGLMTHGAVIAREYGLPAVVGVAHATQLIPDGRRIRVHGTEGYVEILT